MDQTIFRVLLLGLSAWKSVQFLWRHRQIFQRVGCRATVAYCGCKSAERQTGFPQPDPMHFMVHLVSKTISTGKGRKGEERPGTFCSHNPVDVRNLKGLLKPASHRTNQTKKVWIMTVKTLVRLPPLTCWNDPYNTR